MNQKSTKVLDASQIKLVRHLLDPVVQKESDVNKKHPAYPCILVLCYKYEFSFPH